MKSGVSIKIIIAFILGIIVIAIAFLIIPLIFKAGEFCDPKNPDIFKCPILFNPFYKNLNYCNSVFTNIDGDISYVQAPRELLGACCLPFDINCINQKICIGCVGIFQTAGSDVIKLGENSFFLMWNENDFVQSSVRIKNHAYLFESVGDIANSIECCLDSACNSDWKDGFTASNGILDLSNVRSSVHENIKKNFVREITALYCAVPFKKCLLCGKNDTKTTWYICSILEYPAKVKAIPVIHELGTIELESGIIDVKPGEEVIIDGEKWRCNSNFEWEKVKK
ncbi:MAG: hypothetical protein RMJ17_01630 [Candidatus Aenigmarchaeota archaeon]|nr:hypothetical protein [Candidatus Aenigmarchaeota archaeon]MDW8149278.1 hypothetical protein [Candidatus Aenigmarchaeota archaeon]